MRMPFAVVEFCNEFHLLNNAWFLLLIVGMMFVVTYLAQGNIAACVPYIVFTLAGGLFLISDIILSGQYFGPRNTPVNFVLNHVTYYIAQYLIALTIILL